MRAIAELTCLHCGEIADELLLEADIAPWNVGRGRRCPRCSGPLYLTEFVSVPDGTPHYLLRVGRRASAPPEPAVAEATP